MPQYIAVCFHIKVFNPKSSSKADTLGGCNLFTLCLYTAWFATASPSGVQVLWLEKHMQCEQQQKAHVFTAAPCQSSIKDALCLLSSQVVASGHDANRSR